MTTWCGSRSTARAAGLGQLAALAQSCGNGRRWLVRSTGGLLEVDPRTPATRVVLGDPELGGSRWSIGAELDDFLAQSGWSWTDDWGRVIAGNVV